MEAWKTTCRECGAVEENFEDLIFHIIREHGPQAREIPAVPVQEQTVNIVQPVVQVGGEQNPLLHTCTRCHKTFTRKDSLRRHTAIHIREIQAQHVNFHNIAHPLNTNQPTVVNQQARVNNQPVGQTQTSYNHSMMINCNICNIQLMKSNLARHLQNMHGPWIGGYCEDTGLVANPNHQHKPYECPKCSKLYMKKALFVQHLNNCGVNPNTSSVPQQVNSKYYMYFKTNNSNIFLSLQTSSNQPTQHNPTTQDSNNVTHSIDEVDNDTDQVPVENEVENEVEHADNGVNENNNINSVPPEDEPAGDNKKYCRWCKDRFDDWKYHLISDTHKDNAQIPQSENISMIENAFENRIVTYRVYNPDKTNLLYHDFLESDFVKSNVAELLKSYRTQHTSIKYQLELFGHYTKQSEVEEETITSYKKVHFPTKMSTLVQSEVPDLNSHLNDLFNDLLSKTDAYEGQGSGWSLSEVLYLEVYICKYQQLSAGTYAKLPDWIERKRACLNPRNYDNDCFKWVIRAGLKHKELLGEYSTIPRLQNNTVGRDIRHQTTEMSISVAELIDQKYQLNWGDHQFPMKIEAIEDFELNNPNFSVNVYGVDPFDDHTIVGPLHRTTNKKEHHINMLFFENNDNNQHYCLITDLSALVSSQLRKHGRRKEICEGCLQTFSSIADLEEHELHDCLKVVTIVPEKGTTMKYEDYYKQIRQEMTVIADFESVLEPCEDNNIANDIIQSNDNILETLINQVSSNNSLLSNIHSLTSCFSLQVPPDQIMQEINNIEPNSNNNHNTSTISQTGKLHKHIPSSYSYLIKCYSDPSKNLLRTFRAKNGENVAEHFVKSLLADVVPLYEDLVLNKFEKMEWGPVQKAMFQQQTHCHICQKEIKGRKVRDHCHITGKFRGAAHDECNKKYYPRKEVPVLFHNLAKYDAHLFIQELAKIETGRNIEIIPHTDENYITFTKTVPLRRASDHPKANNKQQFLKIRFKDSLKFLAGSLESHAANLDKGEFKNVETYMLPKYGAEITELLKQKGVFPYEFITSFQKYNETRLPSRERFKSEVNNGETVSVEDYNYACYIFNKTECRDVGDYSDLYLETDVLILADVIENFVNNSIEVYGLDPMHYFTLPGFSWDAMLKYTKAEIELLSDLKMINFVYAGIRGGLCQCCHRHAVANNKYLSNYDQTNVNQSYLTYMDVNNLYGVAMSKWLPYNEFSWLEQNEVEEIETEILRGRWNHPENDYHGYILEVDLDYPEELHDLHNDLPFCPSQRKFGNTTKLCATLESKKNYTIHYCNLKQALSHGLVLTKIHKILKFHQKDWLAPYIDFNNRMRTNATTEAQKDLFKLMNNSIFGKTIQNIMKYRNIYLCEKWETVGKRKGANALIATGYMKHYKIFNESLVAVELARKCLNFNKPVIIGFSVLELSKLHMYDFHYNVMKTQYPDPEQLTLCYMDTDSFIYHIKTADYYEDMKPLIH